MSLSTMPLLFVNMGGEMVYILHQRLHAQSVNADKARRVMSDILSTMFSTKFIDEIFKPQPLYSRTGMRSLFVKLAHASIMRLNETSMDKLYDLMTMACKYQLCCANHPKHVLAITLNHLDGMRALVQGYTNVQTQIDHFYEQMAHTYFRMSSCELLTLRSTMLRFYQDARVKVSMLLRDKRQNEDGRFVIAIEGPQAKLPHGGNQPGMIHYFVGGKSVTPGTFPALGTWQIVATEVNLAKVAKKGERGTDLGMNMYGSGSADVHGGSGGSASLSKGAEGNVQNEVQLLSKLLRPASGEKKHGSTKNIVLSLFDNADEESGYAAATSIADDANVVHIDSTKERQARVAKVTKSVGEMSVDKNKRARSGSASRKGRGAAMLQMMDDNA